jgi:hypothetical protein
VREAQEYAKSLQPGYWHQKAVEECGEWKAKAEAAETARDAYKRVHAEAAERAEAAEAKLAEVSGQLATVQSVRVAEEEQMVSLTSRAEYAEARLVEALQRERAAEEALAEVTRHHEQSIELRIALGERLRAVELERNTAHSLILGVQLTCEFGDAKEMYATMRKFSNESQRVVGDAQSYADSYRVVAAMAETAEVYRAELAANTETFRSIIASASGRLVWAVDGGGSPEQALRAVEALGEAYASAIAGRDEAHLRGRQKGHELTLLDLNARGVIDDRQFRLLSSEVGSFAVNDFGRLVQERDEALSLAKSLRMTPETVSALCVLVDHDKTLAMDVHSHVTVNLYGYAAATKAKVSDGW